MTAPNLKTKRLLLRQWKEEDFLPFSKMNADDRVMEFLPSVLTVEQSNALAKNLQKELEDRSYGFWAVEIPKIALFIGFVGLHYQDFDGHLKPCVEIGWRLAFDYWKKGYAFEAASKVVEYAFNVLKLEEIVAFILEKNIRSRKLMEKLGMHHNPQDDLELKKLPIKHPLRVTIIYRLKNASCR